MGGVISYLGLTTRSAQALGRCSTAVALSSEVAPRSGARLSPGSGPAFYALCASLICKPHARIDDSGKSSVSGSAHELPQRFPDEIVNEAVLK